MFCPGLLVADGGAVVHLVDDVHALMLPRLPALFLPDELLEWFVLCC